MATNPSNPFSDILGQYDEDGRPIVGGPFTPMSETDPADVSPDEDPFADIAARYDEDGRPILGAQPPVAPEAAPEVDEDPTWQDYGRMVMSGGARVGQGVGWLMEKLGAEETGRALKERSAESARMWLENKMDVIGLDQEGLSENARRAMQTEFLGEGEFGDKWNKAKLAAASSLLGTMAGMGLGGVFTRGLATVGVGGRTGAAIGYGAGEAGIAAPAGGAATEEDVRSMTHDQLMGSLEYQAVYDGLKNMPEDERRQKARDLVADAAAGKAAALTAVSTFILSAPFSQTIERLAGGIPAPGGRIAGTAKGAAEEATQEFLQSGAEQMAQNIGVRTYADPTRGITEGALEEAVGGALAGGIMGAPAGFATAGGAEAPPAGPVDEITAEDVQGQIDRTRAARTAEMEEAQNAARRRAAALGGDALEQEVAAAEVGARQAGMLDDELAPLMQERDRRVALEEEGRIKTEEFTRRQEDARRLDEGFAKIEQKAQEVRTKAAEEEKTRLAEAKKAAEKQQRADIAENRLRRLRRKRQEKGLEPKEELPGTSPYPSEQVVEAFKGAKPKSMAMAQAFEKAAHEAATSPKNEIPEPTPAQIEAGNYKKGHVKLQGLDISIENPKGSVRSGVSQAGETWSAKMKDHYGYIRGTTSAEGETEKLDVFVGDDAQSDRVFVVDQLNQETGEFDEHKALVGYPNKMAALRAYRRNYEKGWKIGPITEMEVEEFKQWTKTGDMTRPLQKIARPSPRMPATAEQFEEVIQTKTRKEGRRPRVLFRLDEKTKTKVNQPGTTEQKAARGIAEKYFAPERIEEAEKQNSKSRERLVYMSPDDFLAMAEKLRFADTRKAKEVAVVIDELGERWDSLPFLSFENQGEIAKTKGHEGRHRAMDLKRRGVKIMPVRLVSSEGGPAPAIRWGEFIEGGGKLPTKMIGQSGNEIAFPVQQEEMAIQAKTEEAQPRTSDELAVAYTGTISDQTLFRKEADTVPETPDVVTVEEARAVADAVQDRLPLLKVEVVNNAGALPDELYALVAAENGFKAKGFFHPASGRVYLFSDNAESVQDVMKTILHEGVAHKGLGYLLGDQLEPVLRSVYEGADRVALEQIANRYGLDLENEADQLVAAEEHVAKVAESGVYSGLLDRIMSTVRNVLRNLGLIHAWTDSDIRWLLQAASGALKGRPLSKTTITEEVEVAETGEVVEIEEKADVALRRIQKRIGQAQKLRECLSA